MERYGADEARTRELEVVDDSATYIDMPTNTAGDRPTVELVRDEALLVAEPLPIRASPVSAYLAGLAESMRLAVAGA